MNSKILVAAGVSAAIFLGLIGAFVVLSGGSEDPLPPPIVDPQGTGAVVDTGDVAVEDDVATPLPPVDRGMIEVTVEVRDVGGRALSRRGTKVRAWLVSDTDRAGNEVRDIPGVRGGSTKFGVKPGTYEILAQSPGYTGQRQTHTFIKDQEPQTIVFSLDRGTSIAGRVVNRENQPIVGARVYAFRELVSPDAGLEDALRAMVGLEDLQNEIPAETTTDQNGEFRLDGLQDFWYSVRATASGYSPGTVAEVRAPREGLVIVVDRGGVLQGVVQDESGRGVEGATVMAYAELENAGLFEIILSKSRPAVGETKSLTNGSFQLDGLGTGLYNFLVHAPGFQELTEMRVRVLPGENPSKTFVLERGQVIQGYVLDPDQRPIAGAKIRANAIGAHVTPRDQVRIQMGDSAIETDEQGYFRLDTLQDARYMLLVWHDHYESLQRKDVRPGPENLTLQLEPGARLTGTVVDSSTGQPIAGADVSCSDLANLRKRDTTDQNGQFVVQGLGSGRRPINVYVRSDGYARQKRQVTIRKGREYEENFELQPTGVVEGVVVDSTGAAIPGAHIEVRPDEESEASLRILGSGTSDRQGVFYISNVEPGERLRLRVKMEAYLETFAGPFDVNPGDQVNVGRVEIQYGGEIIGLVVDSAGNPVAGAWVEARPEGATDLTPGDQRQSDKSGEFHLKGLREGFYDLIAKANGYVEGRQAKVEVRQGQRNTGVRIVLEQGGVLEGLVIDQGGQPIQGAEVLVRDFGDGIAERRAVSDARGRFKFSNIVAKDVVELEVNHDDYATFSQQDVPVGRIDLEIVLTPLGALVGFVVDPSGQAVSSFTVQPQAADPSQRSASRRLKAKSFSAADGRFEYQGLPAGVYTVFVRSLEFSAITLEGVDVREGEVRDIGEIVLQEGGTVSGTVVDAGTGQPVPGARVRVTQGARAFQPGKAVNLITTQGDGRFVFNGLKDQVLTLEVAHDGYAPQTVTGVDPRVANKSQGLVVELVTAGEVYGVVVDSRRQAVPSISVYLISEGKDGARGGNQTVSTDAQGGFHFRRVTPGTFTVKAYKPGKPPLTDEVSVTVGSGASQEVLLQVE